MDNATTLSKNTNEESLSKPDADHIGPAEGMAAYVGRRTDDAASYVGHKAEDAAHFIGQKSGEAEAAVGSGLRSLGQNVREHGPDHGLAGEAASAVANSLDNSGRYLQEEGIKDIAEDVTNLIRRNPIPALLMAMGAGFLIGRAMTARN
jgi:hypothetical protein